MEIKDRIVVVTGAASGIGRALAQRFAKEGAKLVVCSDINADGVRATASEVGGIAFVTNVAKEADIASMIEEVETKHGPIDLFCSNAGINRGRGVGQPEDWRALLNVNLIAHVNPARCVIPRMAARGGGHFVITASAAGLLTDLRSAPYAASKHAAVGLAECWRSHTRRTEFLCPAYVWKA